jgi:hypothetical protein
LLFFFLHSKNDVLGFKVSPFVFFFLLPLQVCVSTNVCFAKCVFLQLLLLPRATSFFFKFILVSSTFLFCTMVVLVKEARLVVVVDDLDFGIKDVAFD